MVRVPAPEKLGSLIAPETAVAVATVPVRSVTPDWAV
jgi:hypothetical protein